MSRKEKALTAKTRTEATHGTRPERQRIDKWIWFARFARTRPLAVRLLADGYVRLNGTRVSDGSHAVKRGDVLTLSLSRQVLVVKVIDFAERRGAAADALRLYQTEDPGEASQRQPLPQGKDSEL